MRPTFRNTLIKEAVSYFTHMRLRIINLKALAQRRYIQRVHLRGNLRSFCAAHLTSHVLAAMLKATKISETNMAELISYDFK